jgi:tetratricopeptide (TPR) repeat protein
LREVVERNPNNEPSRVELARLLMRLGNDKEAEYYLREVVERNPNDEHSRVELARLLIQRYYKDSQENENQIKEAEDLLKEIIEHNFKDGQSHVVLAKLWLKQTRISEAKDLLTQYLSYCPQKNKVRELLIGIKNNSFNASTWLEFDNDTIINPPKTNNTPHNNHSVNHTMPENLTDLLTELQRRAQLQIEFNQATHLETIETQAKQGDALAYFYWQWLQPEIDLKAPPHAWSAQACRLYQTHADKENWQVLKQSFPEYQEITRFLQLQTHADEKETTLLLDKLSSDNETLSPMQQFIYKALKNNKTDNKIVLAVLSSAAISPPQFVNC